MLQVAAAASNDPLLRELNLYLAWVQWFAPQGGANVATHFLAQCTHISVNCTRDNSAGCAPEGDYRGF